MSDTQGYDGDQSIDDQSDTATGGLANDMPGLPMSPPGRGRPPSALGAIAQMFSGAPAPRPAQPGRSPYQFPGMSQVPTTGGAPKPPPMPSPNQRWQGTTASIGLPRGFPQPHAKFTPFMAGPPTTNYTQWGNVDQDADLPQPFEAPSIYGNLSKFFGQNGSASIIPLALSMGKNGAQFVDGLMKGQEWKAKMHREQLQDDALELQERMQKEMYQYFDTVNEYATTKGVGSAGQVGNYAINGVTMIDALADEARKLGDDKFLAVLGTGDADKAMQFLNERNSNWQTLSKTNKSVEKQTDDDNAKEWGVPDSYGSQGGGESQEPWKNYQRPGQPAPQSGAPQTGGPAPTLQGGGAASPLMTPQGPNGTLAPFQQSGLDNFREGTTLNNVPKGKTRAAAAEYATGLAAQAREVQRQVQTGQLKPEQVPDALDKIVPGWGTDYTQTYRGVPMPPGVQGRSPYWAITKNLAVPDPLTQTATIKDFAPGGRSATRLQAGARMGPAAVTVLEAAKNIPEGETVPQNVLNEFLANKITGDPKWHGLFNSLNTYIQDAQALQSPTGRFFVTEVESLKHDLQTTSGLKAIRTFLQQDAENSSALADQLVREYQHGSQRAGEIPKSYDEENFGLLNTISRLDPERGFEGVSDLPPKLQGLGLGRTGAPPPGSPGTAPTGTIDVPSGWGNLR